MEIFNSPNPINPTSTAGVAFVINKELVNIRASTTTKLIPGCALALILEWHNDQCLTILNVYAPNAPHQHPEFWNTISSALNLHSLRPEILLGNFNLVEDAIDRTPAHKDPETAVRSLRDLREELNVLNTWHNDNPTTRQYTFSNSNHSHSQIDRIYTLPQLAHSLYNWEVKITPIPTDHKLVSVRFAPPRTPYVRSGRWTWLLGLLTDQPLLQSITALGMELQHSLKTSEAQPETTTQKKWANFKK